MSPAPARDGDSAVPSSNTSPDAMLEKLGTVAVEMGRGALSRAFTWAALGVLLGLLGDLVCLAVVRTSAGDVPPLAQLVYVVYFVACPLGSAALLGLYGAQLGAVDAGFRHEPEVGVLAYLARRGAAVAHEPASGGVLGPGTAARAAARASRVVLGTRRPSWRGPFGLVARIVFGTLTHVYERALADALLAAQETAPSIAEEPAPRTSEATTARHATEGIVRGLRSLHGRIATFELVLLIAFIVGLSATWAPVASRLLRLVPL